MPVRALISIWALFPILNIFTKYLLLGRAVLGELILLITFGSLLSGLASLLSTAGIALSSGCRFCFRFRSGFRLSIPRGIGGLFSLSSLSQLSGGGPACMLGQMAVLTSITIFALATFLEFETGAI